MGGTYAEKRESLKVVFMELHLVMYKMSSLSSHQSVSKIYISLRIVELDFFERML